MAKEDNSLSDYVDMVGDVNDVCASPGPSEFLKELDFISKTPPQEVKKEIADMSSTSTSNANANDETMKVEDEEVKDKKIHRSVASATSVIITPKKRTKLEDFSNGSDGGGSAKRVKKENTSTTSTSVNENGIKSEEKKDSGGSGMQNTSSFSLQPLMGIIICSLVSVFTTYFYLRLGLNAFCTYDEESASFMVMEKVSQCPAPVEIDHTLSSTNDETDGCFPLFAHKGKKEAIPLAAVEPLERYIPAPDKGIHEVLCRGTFNILHMGAAMVHPNIDYNTLIPQTRFRSPCPALPPQTIEKIVEEKEKNPFKKGANLVRCIMGKKKRSKKLGSSKVSIQSAQKESNEDESDSDDFDWTKLVAVPLGLDLSAKQIQMNQKVIDNLKCRILKEEDEDGTLALAEQKNWFEDRVSGVPVGGRFPWWFPLQNNWGDDKENSGSRLVTSYMKIMGYPENLMTKFPGSGVCANECHADFALYNTLRFREEYQPWKTTPSSKTINKLGWIYVRGHSPSRHHPDPAVGGSAIMWYTPALKKMQDPEPHTRAILNNLEICVSDALTRSGGRTGKCNIFLNCDGFGLSMIPPITATKRLLKLMQDNYPDKLGVFVIANIGGASQMFLKIILPLLPEVVRQKIHILPNDEEKRTAMMKELVHEPFIPTQYGGSDSYKFDYDTYYKSSGKEGQEIEMMSDEEGIRYYETIPYYGPN